ncbi:MAG: hypothetical protein ACYTJ0_17510 [Planctomycetota bacterium]|jgi:flagellar biosynthesis/type III secretory pathway M-ring protein FliF/YscJ
MQVLQRTIERVIEQLKGLNPTSRLLVGSLAIILAMSLGLVALYSGRSSLVALPVQEGAARSSAMQYLNSRQIDWKERDGQILVPAEQRHVLLAQMTENQIIGPDQIDFDMLVRQDSPFLSKAQNDRNWLVATMNHLTRTISRMQGVRRADVVIDEPSRPSGLGRAHLAPSAMVTVVTDGSPLNQSAVDAIARMVAGAHAELKVADVEVIDALSARAFHATDDRRPHAGKYLELQESTTTVYEGKLGRALSYIPGVNIAVNVIVDHREVLEQTQRLDDPKQGITRESSRNISSSSRIASGEAGVRPNTGASLAAARPTTSMSDERSDTTMVPAFGGTNARTLDPGGYALKINAAIGVPRSYFVRLFRDQAAGDGQDPDAATLQPFVEAEIDRIRQHVQPLVDTGPNGGPVQGSVAVRMIPDYRVAGGEGESGGPIGGLSGGLLTESLVKYGSLAGLAILSLAMMFMMVRKANARQSVPSLEELLGRPPVLPGSDGELAGEAEAVAIPMEGREVDEAMLRRQQMLQQINELARSSPDDVAMVLKRWMRTA